MAGSVAMDAGAVEKLDSSGAWLLLRTHRALENAGRTAGALKVPERYASLLANLDRDDKKQRPGHHAPRMSPWHYRLYRIGKATIEAGRQACLESRSRLRKLAGMAGLDDSCAQP